MHDYHNNNISIKSNLHNKETNYQITRNNRWNRKAYLAELVIKATVAFASFEGTAREEFIWECDPDMATLAVRARSRLDLCKHGELSNARTRLAISSEALVASRVSELREECTH